MQKKVLPVLFVTLLLDMVSMGMLLPILPIIFTDSTSAAFLLEGYSTRYQYILAGLLMGIFGIMQFLAAPLMGEFSDRFGRKRLLTIGVSILTVAHLFFALGLELRALWLLFASRVIAGLAGANFSIVQASIADVTPKRDRARNFGLIGSAFGIGFIIGPLLGGWLAEWFGHPSAPFWVAGAIGGVNVILISMLFPETHAPAGRQASFALDKSVRNIRAAFDEKGAGMAFLGSFLFTAGILFFTTFIGILLVDRFGVSEPSIGNFYAVVGAWVILTQAFILRLVNRRFSERQVLSVVLPIAALALPLLPFLPSLFYLYLLMPFLAIPCGLALANLMALVSKSVSAERQGTALGINGSLMALAQGAVPLLAGFATGFTGLATPFIVGSLLIAAAWGVLFLKKKRGGLEFQTAP